MEKRALGKTGEQVSVLGYGASPLGGVFGEVEAGEAKRAVHAAVDLGFNLFDVAPYYGMTRAETALGAALQGIPREKYLLATKVGRYGAADFDFSPQRVLRSIEESLQRLQVETIDICTCHDIEFVPIAPLIETTLPALEKARNQGKIRYIGVSGLPLQIYHTVLEQARLDTILSYCHYTLNDTLLAGHLDTFNAKGVGIMNASPFAMGLLTDGPLPEWHPAPEALKSACRAAAAFCREQGVEIAQIALQFTSSEPRIATTLVGMRSQAEVEQNARWLAMPLDRALLAKVQALLAPVHNLTWPSGLPENSG